MIEEAVQAVVTALKAPNLDRGDGQPLNVTDFMPIPGAMDKPCAVAVWFDVLEETDFGIKVTLVADTSSDPEAAERLCRSLVEDLDAACDALPVPRSSWRKTYSPEFSAYIVETLLGYPRDDF